MDGQSIHNLPKGNSGKTLSTVKDSRKEINERCLIIDMSFFFLFHLLYVCFLYLESASGIDIILLKLFCAVSLDDSLKSDFCVSFPEKRDGQYRIDSQATPTMLNCLMYKLSYYRCSISWKMVDLKKWICTFFMSHFQLFGTLTSFTPADLLRQMAKALIE